MIAIPESITTANLAVPVFLLLKPPLGSPSAHRYLRLFLSVLLAHSTAQNDIHFPEEKLYRTDKQCRCSQSGNTGRSLSDRCHKWRYRSFYLPTITFLQSYVIGGLRGEQPLSSGLHMDNWQIVRTKALLVGTMPFPISISSSPLWTICPQRFFQVSKE